MSVYCTGDLWLAGQHAEVPAADDFAPAEGEGFDLQLGQGQDHAAVIEHGAAGIDHESVADLECIDLVGVADNQYIGLEIGGVIGLSLTGQASLNTARSWAALGLMLTVGSTSMYR